MKKIYILLFFLSFAGLESWAQKDTIKLINEDILVGEIEKLDKSVFTFSTDYSDSDFKIEWDKVLEIKSQRTFIMAFSDGVRVTGNLNSIPETDKMVRVVFDGQTEEESLNDLIFLEPIGKGALSNLSIDVDLGITLTKANNFRQLNTYIGGTYLAKRWNANAFFKTVLSSQDNTADIRRMDAELGGQYFLPHDWFVTARGKYLANDEQLLDLRQTYQAGVGYYFIHNNSMYLALSAVYALN